MQHNRNGLFDNIISVIYIYYDNTKSKWWNTILSPNGQIAQKMANKIYLFCKLRFLMVFDVAVSKYKSYRAVVADVRWQFPMRLLCEHAGIIMKRKYTCTCILLKALLQRNMSMKEFELIESSHLCWFFFLFSQNGQQSTEDSYFILWHLIIIIAERTFVWP